MIGNKSIVNIYYKNIPVLSIYKKTTLVWSSLKEIESCYYAGYWQDEYPWTDDTSWE